MAGPFRSWFCSCIIFPFFSSQRFSKSVKCFWVRFLPKCTKTVSSTPAAHLLTYTCAGNDFTQRYLQCYATARCPPLVAAADTKSVTDVCYRVGTKIFTTLTVRVGTEFADSLALQVDPNSPTLMEPEKRGTPAPPTGGAKRAFGQTAFCLKQTAFCLKGSTTGHSPFLPN